MAGNRPGAVSVVVPAYNAGQFLDETLTSISDQTDRTWHCIVVDDGSTDATAEIVQRVASIDPRFELVQQVNQGVASARNHGIRVSESDYLLFLDADDLLEADAIKQLKTVLESAPNSPAAHGKAMVIDSTGEPSSRCGYEQSFGRQRLVTPQRRFVLKPKTVALPDISPTGLEALLLRNSITTPGQVLVRRSALSRTTCFDVDAPPAEDWDLWIQIACLGEIAFLPRTVLRYRSHGGGASRQLSKMRAAELRVRHKVIRSPHLIETDGARSRAVGLLTDADIEQLARMGLRRVELTRASERAKSAFDQLLRADVRESARDVLRTGSSLQQVGRSLLPTFPRSAA